MLGGAQRSLQRAPASRRYTYAPDHGTVVLTTLPNIHSNLKRDVFFVNLACVTSVEMVQRGERQQKRTLPAVSAEAVKQRESKSIEKQRQKIAAIGPEGVSEEGQSVYVILSGALERGRAGVG